MASHALRQPVVHNLAALSAFHQTIEANRGTGRGTQAGMSGTRYANHRIYEMKKFNDQEAKMISSMLEILSQLMCNSLIVVLHIHSSISLV